METLTITDELLIKSCITCGVRFGMPRELYRRCQEEGPGKPFFCPNGHAMICSSSIIQQENERLKIEAEYLRQAKTSLHNQLTEKEQALYKLNKQVANRNKRLKAGVCPCCNRTFKELAAHMENKHPDYAGKLRKPIAIHQKISIKGAITKS